jgi:hypothetical protein
MTAIRISLTLMSLLLLVSPGFCPAAAQMQTAGEVQSYGNQTATYAVGCQEHTLTSYLKATGREMTPTTPENAQAIYTNMGTRTDTRGEMISQGGLTATGSGIPSSFLQTQTLNLSLEGKLETCSEESFGRQYTGTQTLEGATVPGGGAGELQAYGRQTLNLSAAQETATVKPLNQGAAETAGSQSSGTSTSPDNGDQDAASGNSSGRLSLRLDASSIAQVSRTGPGVAGSYTQTQSVGLGPHATGQAGANAVGPIPGVTGTTTVTCSQSTTASTGN